MSGEAQIGNVKIQGAGEYIPPDELEAKLQALYLKLMTLHDQVLAANTQIAHDSIDEAISMLSQIIDLRRAPKPE